MANLQALWDQYQATGNRAHSVDFGVWLIQQQLPLNNQAARPVNQPVSEGQAIHPGSMASILVGRLHRFVEVLSKPAFKEAGIHSPDEFGLLATLFFLKKTTKGKLFKQALMESTTGSEMLKRMRADGLVVEKANPKDGRSTLVALTDKGKRITGKAFGLLDGLAHHVLANLSADEQTQLLRLLAQLDGWHSQREQVESVLDVMHPTQP